MKRLIVIIALLVAPASAQFPWSGILDPTRAINWAGAGVPGGIPTNRPVCSTLTSPGSGVDATSLIQTALNSAPCVNSAVLLNAGTFRINTQLVIPSNVTLRGTLVAGSGNQTIIDCRSTTTQSCISFGNNRDDSQPPLSNGSSTTFTNAAQGATAITVASTSGMDTTTHNQLMLTQLNPSFVVEQGNGNLCNFCNYGFTGMGDMGQTVHITSIVGNVVSFTPPLYLAYNNSPSAFVYTQAVTKNAGLEYVHIKGNNTGYKEMTMMQGSYASWVLGTEIDFADNAMMFMYNDLNCEVRDSFFHDGFNHGSGTTDGQLNLAYWSSNNLVINNIFWRQHASVMHQRGASGNVVAYNFSTGNYHSPGVEGWQIPDLNWHGTWTMMELLEGNEGDNTVKDDFWGSSGYTTFFRHYSTGSRLYFPPRDTRGALVGGANPRPSCAASPTSSCWEDGFSPSSGNTFALDINGLSQNDNLVGVITGSTHLVTTLGGASLKISPTTGFGNQVCNRYGYNGSDDDLGFYSITGSVTSGVFVASEIIKQANTNATAVLDSAVTGSNPMTVRHILGSEDSSHNWVGQTSGAVYAPSSAPTPSSFNPTNTTMFRHGINDCVTNVITWDAGHPNHTLPASFFLSSKPAFFGSTPWPAIGPDITGGAGWGGFVNINPAHQEFNAATSNGTTNTGTFDPSFYLTAPSPGVSLSPTSLTFAGQVVNTSSASQAITLTNTGTASLTINSITITGTNVGDFSQTNNCPATLTASSSCTINVTFTPIAAGSRSANVSVSDNASGSPQIVPLTGTGFAPAVSLTPSSLTFGSQNVGTTSASQALTLTNTGTSTLTITSISITGNNAGDFGQTNTCGATLAAAASCTINVTFTPTVSGSRTASVTVADNASGSPHSSTLSGTGVAPGVNLSPPSLSFNLQIVGSTSAPQTIVLTNSGNATLTIASQGVSGDFSETSTTCGATLAAGASCNLNIAFTPTTGGTRTGTLTIFDNAQGSPHKATLTGAGLLPGIILSGNPTISGNIVFSVANVGNPGMSIAPASLAFGSVSIGSVNTLSLTITSTGTVQLVVATVTLGDAVNYSQTNNCSVVPPAGTCTINVTFSPHSVGTLNSTVTIAANDPSSPHVVTLTATGAAVSGDLPFPNFVLQGGVAFLMPQSFVDPMVAFQSQTVQQAVWIGNSTCPLAPARTNYKGVAVAATVCDYADSNGTGLQTTINDWCGGTFGGDQRWDVLITHGSSFNFAGNSWVWCDKFNGTPTTKFIAFHSDTGNPRGRTVCSHGIQDTVNPPLPDMGQRNHGCAGLLGTPSVTSPVPATSGSYTNDSTYNDLANMWTVTSTNNGVGSVVSVGPASTLGSTFNDCGVGFNVTCPTDGVNHIILQDARVMPAASVTGSSFTPTAMYPLEWQGHGITALSPHDLPAAPHDIGFDENYFTADADDDGFGNNPITDMVKLACANCWFNHNYLDGAKRDGSEDHGINLSDAPGPVMVVHNYLECCAIPFWGGGGGPPAIQQALTTNVERRRNHVTYLQRWLPSPGGIQSIKKSVTGGSCASNVLTVNMNNGGTTPITNLIVYLRNLTGTGSVSSQWYTATSVTATNAVIPVTCTNGSINAAGNIFGFASGVNVTSATAMNGKAVSDPNKNNPVYKNASENKEGASTIQDGEILENCGADGQTGFCLLVSVRSCFESASCEHYQIIDWATTNTIIRHGNQGIQISARSGGNNNASFPITAITCAADGKSAAITATGANAALQNSVLGGQTTFGTDIFLASIGNGVTSGAPLLASGYYATNYPTGGSFSNDAIVTVKNNGAVICLANDTTSSGTLYGPTNGNGSGVSVPGRRYIFQNNLIYDIGNHTQWDGAGSITLLQNGGGVNNWSVSMTVTQVNPVTIVNAAVTAINVCPINQLCPKVIDASVGDFAYVQCLGDTRFSSGPPATRGAPMISVAGNQLSFTYAPQNGSPALALTDTTTCSIAGLDSNVDSGYYGSQTFPWPFYWNHNTAVGVNNFVSTPGGGGFVKYATFKNSLHLLPGVGDITTVNTTANSGGFRCANSDKYSSTDLTGVTFCNDRATLNYSNYAVSTRSIDNNPNFLNGVICGEPPSTCSHDPAVNIGANTTPARVSTPGLTVTCGGVPCDATHFIPDSIGFMGSMNTNNYPLNLPDFRNYALDPSSPYRANGILDASDSLDDGVQMSILLNAQERTLYVCPLPCGAGPHRDGPQYAFLLWSPSTDPSHVNYRVYRNGAGSPTATATNTFYSDYGLPSGASSWVVKDFNGTIETPVSGLTSTVF